MSKNQQNQHIAELIPAYVIGCLEVDEAVLVMQHLAECEQCQAEFSGYQQVADQLAYAAPDAEPDPGVKVGLMERVRAAEAARHEGPTQPSLWQRAAGLWGRWAPVWAVAGVILVILLGASNIILWQRVNDLQGSPQPVAMRTINMGGTTAAPRASGLIVVSSDGDHGTLVVEHLPALEEGHQYQLWLIEDGERTSGGVFSVDGDGYGALWVSSPRALSEYSAFGVTIEPSGGSPGPTGEKVLGSET